MDGVRFDDFTRSLSTTRSRRHLLAGVAALLLGGATGSLAAPGTAIAGRRQVIRCQKAIGTDGNTNFDIQGRHAQTFKVPVSGKLTQVSVILDHRIDSTGDYVGQIVPVDATGAPMTAKILAEKTIPGGGLQPGGQPLTFAFTGGTAPEVRQNRRYAVVVGRSGGRFGLLHRWYQN